jgi:uncharacterized protein YkwD
LHCEIVCAILAALFFREQTAMFHDALTRFWCLLFAVLATSFLLTPASHVQAQKLKEFDARYLEPPRRGPQLRKAEQEVLRLTNAFRKQAGREPLKTEKRLEKAAAYFAAFMARTDKYGHDADDNKPEDRIAACQYEACLTAENIAYAMDSDGFATKDLARTFFEMWKKSPPHRDNMLDPDATEVGIAIAFAPASGRYYVVQDLASPKTATIRFQVTNQTTETLRYRVKSAGHGEPPSDEIELPPRGTMIHASCRSAKLDWSWTKPDDEVPVENNQQFVIRKTDRGFEVSKQPLREQ